MSCIEKDTRKLLTFSCPSLRTSRRHRNDYKEGGPLKTRSGIWAEDATKLNGATWLGSTEASTPFTGGPVKLEAANDKQWRNTVFCQMLYDTWLMGLGYRHTVADDTHQISRDKLSMGGYCERFHHMRDAEESSGVTQSWFGDDPCFRLYWSVLTPILLIIRRNGVHWGRENGG